MTDLFNRLNLSPLERRAFLLGLVAVALLLNYWFVVPYFGEWRKITQDNDEQMRLKAKYLAEIARKPQHERRIQELQREGAQVPRQEAANRLQQVIYTEASRAGITISRLTPQVMASRAGGQTNQFFEEHVVKIDITAGEEQLVDFLYRLGSGDSMIRVRDVANLRLDQSQTRLMASLDLVASFPRRTGSGTTPSPSRTPAVAETTAQGAAAPGGGGGGRTLPGTAGGPGRASPTP
jgi:hypothetical protein